MASFSLLQQVEPLLTSISRYWEIGSSVIATIAILWFLNFFIGLIRNTYAVGHAFGRFYWSYLHQHVITITAFLPGNLGGKRPESTKSTSKAAISQSA
ncbi:MAG: hypothetical protein AB8A46_04100 [Prochlorococcus sp.]|jgi:hypothetical protein